MGASQQHRPNPLHFLYFIVTDLFSCNSRLRLVSPVDLESVVLGCCGEINLTFLTVTSQGSCYHQQLPVLNTVTNCAHLFVISCTVHTIRMNWT